jgi:poly(rC)-binding protein 2/3/4
VYIDDHKQKRKQTFPFLTPIFHVSENRQQYRMSASPSNLQSTKRPLEDPSSPSGPNDQPDAKRPALDKVVKSDPDAEADVSSNQIPSVEDTKDIQGDTVVPDAPNGKHADTQPIQSTASHGERAGSQSDQHTPQDETNWIHIRAVISSPEAATVIGKGGENVSQIRRLSGAKCTVSDYSRGAVERILTVSGPQDAVAKVSFILIPTSVLDIPR